MAIKSEPKTTDNLQAKRLHDTWCVEDSDGGVWWPNEEAAAEIERSEEPQDEAVRICSESPMRGEWRA